MTPELAQTLNSVGWGIVVVFLLSLTFAIISTTRIIIIIAIIGIYVAIISCFCIGFYFGSLTLIGLGILLIIIYDICANIF